MKVALTGVTGHLGAAVARVLVAEGHAVNVLVRGRDDRSYRGLGVQVFSGDILDTSSLVPFLKDTDAIIHCAGVISVDGDRHGKVMAANVQGTQNVFHSALSCGVHRAIHISSIHVYEQLPLDQQLNELRSSCSHPTAYDLSKQQGQKIALEYQQRGMEVIIMQPTGIIGPYDYKPSRTGKTILSIMRGRMPFSIAGGFDFCDSRDVAKAIVTALRMGEGGEQYILAGRWATMQEIVSHLGEIRGKRIQTIQIPHRVARSFLPFAEVWTKMTNTEAIFTRESLHTVMTGNQQISSDKARNAFGYTCRPLKDTLRDTVDWFTSEGYLRK